MFGLEKFESLSISTTSTDISAISLGVSNMSLSSNMGNKKIVPEKNFKVWRCVCAKRIPDDGRHCKCRAESCIDNSNVITKAFHNHPPNHHVAEIKFIKSQVLVAAFENPDHDAEDLVNQACMYFSEGVCFDNKESIKASIISARNKEGKPKKPRTNKFASADTEHPFF
ncbi:hypothetical protein CAEBREN_09737 [Caenorhabditis brenneri]|uniref:FLYWCH-type domain-containing protein n=1 Tax=Caenorhabditis brenneri TaxID=135651 RepID=G0MY67_CAEBE|nr:hypothetical protein CAEBREN_09737 [Caenorhabditis brenneri]